MSISGTLSSALSGLTATAKAAEIVSSNIANATTPGYGRRTLQTTSRVVGTSGQGVLITGVDRAVNLPLLSDRRLAQSASAGSDTLTAFYRRLETTLGTPDQAFSITGRASALSASLTEAISHPESEPRLANVLSSAKGLAGQITTASRDVQAARTVADGEIGNQVTLLNAALDRISKLNVQIRKGSGTGQDVSALLDQRQQQIDTIAPIIPLREVQLDQGAIALYSTNGAQLVDPSPAVFGFTPSSSITPYMTVAGGGLSGLTINGRALATSGDRSPILGGSLAANFAVRDDLGVKAQAQLDGVARDLVERFQDSNLDTTRAPGDAGLFTDTGASFDPARETGLAQRLKINSLADPDKGGALWHLRDGLGAATPGPVGATGLLSDLRNALSDQRAPASGGFMPGQRSFSTLTSDMLSSAATNRLTAEGEQVYNNTRVETFTSLEAQDGVDTDQEMQSLLQIEQSYAANAKVIKTVDMLIQTLLEI